MKYFNFFAFWGCQFADGHFRPYIHAYFDTNYITGRKEMVDMIEFKYNS